MKILADGSTSRLYRKLVVEDKVAATTGGDYSGYNFDCGAISLYAVSGSGNDLKPIEAAVDGVLDDIRKNGVTELELERAKKALLADYIYESDNQANLARRYGWAVAIGRSPADVEGWPAALAKVTTDDIKKAAENYLDARQLGDRLAVAGARGRQAGGPSGRAARRAFALVIPSMQKGMLWSPPALRARRLRAPLSARRRSPPRSLRLPWHSSPA